jgi:putative ABC transport system permease protein
MRISDYIEQSFANLWKKKLRTFLTTFGVVIGIGALVSMIAFGKGIQKNVTDEFNKLDLFNYISVTVSSSSRENHADLDQQPAAEDVNLAPQSEPHEAGTRPHEAGTLAGVDPNILDDTFIREVTGLKGVEYAFPEICFPAMIRFKGKEEFSFIQVLPVYVTDLMKLRAGESYTSDEENCLMISDSMLRRMRFKNFEEVIGQQIELSTLTLDFNIFNLANIVSFFKRGGKNPNGTKSERLPFATRSYTFTIVGVVERMGFGGAVPLRSDVYIPPGPSQRMKKLSLTSIWDFFQSPGQIKGYPSVSVKLTSAKYVEPVKKKIQDWGFKTFALIDQLEEMKRVFIFMDMFLFAVGMIAIVVASLGIINTMVMSILERYKEIGIAKAVGASDRDVKKIFLFESGTIGFLGGVFGLILGWAVSMIINLIINSIASREGVPYINYFSFSWWLCMGAIIFSILVSLAAGIYPTIRAARVDPVVALRHD